MVYKLYMKYGYEKFGFFIHEKICFFLLQIQKGFEMKSHPIPSGDLHLRFFCN